MKACNNCKIEKELSEFTLDSRNRDGRQGICSECRKIQKAEVRNKRLKEGNLIIITKKTCSKCKIEKHAIAFYRDAGSSDGLRPTCKDCKDSSVAIWREKKREEYNTYMREYRKTYPKDKMQRRNRGLRFRYGIDQVEYNRMLLEQQGNCKMCGITPKDRPLVVDHDHNTKAIRGLLCDRCNTSIAIFDNKELLEQAKIYLKLQ